MLRFWLFFLRQNVDFFGDSVSEGGEHVALGHAFCPCGPELVVGLVAEFPIPSPFEAEAFAERSEFVIQGVLAAILFATENSDVEGEAEIVVRVAGGGVGDLFPGVVRPRAYKASCSM